MTWFLNKHRDTNFNLSKSKTIFNYWDKLDFEQIYEKIEETELMKRKKAEAVLNALKLNPVGHTGRHFHREDPLLHKFQYVLERAKSHMWLGNDEIKERDRTTVIESKERIYEKSS